MASRMREPSWNQNYVDLKLCLVYMEEEEEEYGLFSIAFFLGIQIVSPQTDSVLVASDMGHKGGRVEVRSGRLSFSSSSLPSFLSKYFLQLLHLRLPLVLIPRGVSGVNILCD